MGERIVTTDDLYEFKMNLLEEIKQLFQNQGKMEKMDLAKC